MQASTWNETIQHWVPRFLLKGFGIKGRASKVFALDKQTGKITTCDVETVASKQGLLTERDDELMKDLEVRSAQVVGRIRKGDLKSNPEQRQILDTLVYSMIINDPYSGVDHNTTRTASVENISSKIGAALNRRGGFANTEHLNEMVNNRLNHDYLNIAMEMDDNLVLTALSLMGLSVHEPEAGEFFVIGDSPVLIVRGTVDGERSLLNPGSQVLLPISSKRVLVYSWETPSNLIQPGVVLEREVVRSLSTDYYFQSGSLYIFGRHRASLEYARTSQNQRDASRRSTQANDGWAMMQSMLHLVSRSRAQKDQESETNFDLIARDLVTRAQADLRRPTSEDEPL